MALEFSREKQRHLRDRLPVASAALRPHSAGALGVRSEALQKET